MRLGAIVVFSFGTALYFYQQGRTGVAVVTALGGSLFLLLWLGMMNAGV